MPAEWAPHRRTWLAWPCRAALWGEHLEDAKHTYAAIAQAIAGFEPVTVLARPDLTADASLHCGKGISVLPMQQDDSWVRDTGPAFLVSNDGRLGGVAWTFNGWGETYPDHVEDARMARRMLEHVGAETFTTPLVLEGGGVHVDGEGTALLCERSVLDAGRNPDRDRADVERELDGLLGIDKVIWLDGSLTDDETGGHIDNLACFSAPGKVLALDPATAGEADRPGLERNLQTLRAATDAAGRSLEITLLPLPKPRKRADGRLLTLTYINFYVCNGAVIVPVFEDYADETAKKLIGQAFPDRKLVPIDAAVLLQGGGGIHCVTQQQPLPPVVGDER
ncbi:MAG: agmatine deiminase family protein [Geminicoccaceae bacterium]|jgi:agmatine deiminase|nr:agmatine deiminase family protein [Geminicoccaceae bacterium]